MSELKQNEMADLKPKRMLEWSTLPDGRQKVAVNYSSLELIQTCQRKAYYALVRELRAEEEAAPLAFGSAIHKGLEHWYMLDTSQRALSKSDSEDAELLANGFETDVPRTGALESIRQFCLRGEALKALPQDDKRSLQNGVKILKAYFKHYANDSLAVATDAFGPIVERQFEFPMFQNDKFIISYHGTIDVVLRNIETGLYLITDHKTTHALGTEFYQRCKPNPQYTGYVMGAQKCLGIDTNLFMVNGIQVAKTKTEFARQVTTRDESDFEELKSTIWSQLPEFSSSAKILHDPPHQASTLYRELFPQSAPNPCSMYGACQYRGICEVPENLKENVIRSRWPSSVEIKKPSLFLPREQ